MNSPRLGPRIPLPRLWFFHLSTIVVLAATAVPGINESHYLPKAKHFWDPSFAARDLFLASHDSHFLTSATAGILTLYLPLPVATWLCRFAAWAFMALAWGRLAAGLRMNWWQSLFGLAGWYVANHYGHWAGEWFLGGFEAKAIAYPCVVMALANLVEDRWRRVWPWLGFAMAWHPLVGGWAGLTAGMLWCIENRGGIGVELRQHWRFLLAGAGLALIGILPALGGLGSPNREGPIVASQVQVYFRLSHHLCPRLFTPERHWAAAATLAVFILNTLLVLRQHRRADRATGNEQGARRLIAIAWLAIGLALIGLLVDLLMSDDRLPTYQPELASQILRFYWFRWADVAVPLGVVASIWSAVSGAGLLRCEAQPPGVEERQRQSRIKPGRETLLVGIWGFAALGGTVVGIAHLQLQRWQEHIAPADRLVATPPGPHAVQTDRVVDWIAVCTWIRDNTPADSLWLTPKYQQTFKWYAGRAEIVNWKDVPQDNKSVIEWFRRIRRCEPPRDANGKLRGWTTDELLDIAAEYGAHWIVVDRSIQKDPPLLEIRYPIEIENRSFAVFFVHPMQIEQRGGPAAGQ